MSLDNLTKTPLFDLHQKLGAKLIDFGGFALPVSYKLGIIGEHKAVRENVGVFDVSHMGVIDIDDSSNSLSKIIPANIKDLKAGKQVYTLLLNEDAGIIDDLIVTKLDENKYRIVLNASRKFIDIEHIKKHMPDGTVTYYENSSIIAVQGPKAADIVPSGQKLSFMESKLLDDNVMVSRSGYTGEDGFEYIFINGKDGADFAEAILKNPIAEPIGLGARDTLRLEAGLCLYGNDLTEAINPKDAGLMWCICKEKLKDNAFIGAKALNQIEKVSKRAGIIGDKRPARAGTVLKNDEGDEVGIITSGAFSPSISKPIAMAVIDKNYVPGDKVNAMVGGKSIPMVVTKMPFITKNYSK